MQEVNSMSAQRMLNIWRRCFVTLAFSVVAGTPAQVFAGAPRGLAPEGVHYHRFAAAVNGTEAIWRNPAGLGAYRIPSTLIMYDQRDPGFGDDRGLALSAKGFGYAYRKLADLAPGSDYTEHTFAAGHRGTSGLAVGGSYRYVTSGPADFNKRHFWNLGILYRKDEYWSAAAVYDNWNKSRVFGERSTVEQTYALAVRPLGTPQLTLNAELEVSHKQRLKDGEFRFGAEGSPIPGLFLYSYLSENDDFQLGARVNFTRTFVGAQTRHDEGGDVRSATAFLGAVAEPLQSIVRPRSRVLRVGIAGSIKENPTQTVFGPHRLAFVEYIIALQRAVTDESISNVVVTIGRNKLSWAQTQEVRNAMLRLSGAGKEVTAYLGEPSNRNYYLATAADNIVLAPVGYLGLTGLYAELTFIGGTLEKLGVTVDGYRIGDHKTAPEFYTNRGPSEINKEDVNRTLDEIYAQLVTGIVKSRGLSREETLSLIDRGPLTSREALDAKLVDYLAYPDEVEKKIPGLKKPVVGLRDFVSEHPFTDAWTEPPVIAVVVAEGSITQSPSRTDPSQGGRVSAAGISRGFSEARADHLVRGYTLRVNSPGGSALESDLIFRHADLARKKRPLNVSMSGVAASGGYYISAPGRKVFASPATITGSIGIFALKPDLEGLYEKIDLGKYQVSRGANAGMFSLSRPFSDSEKERLKFGLQSFYQHFLEVVADNRGLATDSVDALGQGKVWTGREARDNGLVDSLGGIWEAITATAEDAGLGKFQVRVFPQKKTLFSFGKGLLGNPLGALSTLLGKSDGPIQLSALAGTVLNELEYAGHSGADDFLMRLPFDLDIE